MASPENHTNTPEAKVVIGDKSSWWKGHTRALIVAAVVIVVAAIVAGGIIYYKRTHPAFDKNQSIYNQATGLYLTGHSANAQRLLSQQIAATGSKVKQAKYWAQKSIIAFMDGDYKDGLSYAEQSNRLNPTADSADLIAKNAERLGEKGLALKYYKIELQLVGRPLVTGANDALEAKIKELGG